MRNIPTLSILNKIYTTVYSETRNQDSFLIACEQFEEQKNVFRVRSRVEELGLSIPTTHYALWEWNPSEPPVESLKKLLENWGPNARHGCGVIFSFSIATRETTSTACCRQGNENGSQRVLSAWNNNVR